MKKPLWIFLFCVVGLFFYSQNKPSGKSYTGMGALSEIVMSSKCATRSNFNLFFESNISLSEKDRPMVWYKFLFHDSCRLSFTLIPIDEADRYEIEVYTSRPFAIPCTQSLDSAFSKFDSISKTINYKDNFQSQSFRQSLYHTKEIKIKANESVYIIIHNLSGPDAGHVIDVQTCDYSYVLKANKIKVDDPSKIDRSSYALPKMRLKSLVEKMCNEVKGQEMGYTQFIGDKMISKNVSSKSLDSASKKQTQAVHKWKENKKNPNNKTTRLKEDSLKNQALNNKDKSIKNLQSKTNKNDSTASVKNNNNRSLSQKDKENKKLKDSVTTISHKEKNIQDQQNKKNKGDSLKIVKQHNSKINTQTKNHKNIQDTTHTDTKNKEKQADNRANDNQQKKNNADQSRTQMVRDTSTQISISNFKTRKDSIASNDAKTKAELELKQKQKQAQINMEIRNNLFSMLSKDETFVELTIDENTILSGYKLIDSIYNILPEERKNYIPKNEKTDKELIKNTNSKTSTNTTPHNISVYFIVVDARNKKIIKTADVKYRINNTRNFFTTEKIDTLSAYKAGFMNNSKMIVECNVFGYHHYKSKFEIDFAVNKDPVFYDFIFMQPLGKGEILELPNVYFHPNSTVLKQSSYKELDKLVNYMKSTPAIVRIDGHTQGNQRIVNTGPKIKEEFQFKGSAKKLSRKRAERVYDYLIEKGVDTKRIGTKGFGGKSPKIKNPETRSEKEMNMRVEITIVDFRDKQKVK